MTNRPTKELAIDILEYLGELEVNQFHTYYDEMGLAKVKGKAEQILENSFDEENDFSQNPERQIGRFLTDEEKEQDKKEAKKFVGKIDEA